MSLDRLEPSDAPDLRTGSVHTLIEPADRRNPAAANEVGQLQILGQMAKSSLGTFFKATDLQQKRTVVLWAVKLSGTPAEVQAALQRFRAQARAASVLNSQNIARVYRDGEHGGTFYIVIEHVDGVTLERRMAEQQAFPAWELIDITRQVCSGLDHARAHGVVHTALSPANLMLEWDSTVKLTDFGIPKLLRCNGHIPKAVPYMSPEQVLGHTLDGRSNLFSFGAVLYEMVTGVKPFGNTDAEAIRQAITAQNVPAAHQVNSGVHPGISAVIARALAKSPADRYQSGADLVRDLENYKSLAPETRKGVVAVATPEPQPSPAPAAPAVPVPAVEDTQKLPPLIAVAKPAVETSELPQKRDVVQPKPGVRRMPARLRVSRQVLHGAIAAVFLLVVGVSAYWVRRPAQVNAPAAAAAAPAVALEEPVPPLPVVETEPAREPGRTQPAPAHRFRKVTQRGTPALAAPLMATTGGIVVDSNPAGAQVEVDGRAAPGWTTPLTMGGLEPGSHTVVLRREGYTPETRAVEVTAGGQAIVAVTLNQAMATLAVTSEPAGAAVLVDGRDTGKVTPARIDVMKGNHTVTVRRIGYFEAATSAHVSSGQTFNFGPRLTVMGSTGEVRTAGRFSRLRGMPDGMGAVKVEQPKGAGVEVNGRALEKRAPLELFLNPGNYEITIKPVHGQPRKQLVRVVQSETLTIGN